MSVPVGFHNYSTVATRPEAISRMLGFFGNLFAMSLTARYVSQIRIQENEKEFLMTSGYGVVLPRTLISPTIYKGASHNLAVIWQKKDGKRNSRLFTLFFNYQNSFIMK